MSGSTLSVAILALATGTILTLWGPAHWRGLISRDGAMTFPSGYHSLHST